MSHEVTCYLMSCGEDGLGLHWYRLIPLSLPISRILTVSAPEEERGEGCKGHRHHLWRQPPALRVSV